VRQVEVKAADAGENLRYMQTRRMMLLLYSKNEQGYKDWIAVFAKICMGH